MELRIRLQPKQSELLRLVDESKYTRIAWGGSRGAGKSGGVRRILILRRLKYANTNGLILRRTYRELYENHLEPLFSKEFPFMRSWWSEEHKHITFPNGSKLYFGYAEHEVDVERYVGSEYGDICPEEAGLFTERELEKLWGSCRWTGNPDFHAKMIYPFMPGGRGHSYLKRVFHDQDYRGEEQAETFAFIRAFGWDNVEWAREALRHDGLTEDDYYSWSDAERRTYFIQRTDYGRKLAALTDPQLRAAWLEGSMEITEGLVFPELHHTIHDLDQYVPDSQWETFCKTLRCIGCIDHASSGVTAYVQSGQSCDNNFFSLEEYYERNKTVKQHSGPIRALISRYASEHTLIDPSTEAKTLQGKNPQTNRDEMWSVQEEYLRNGVAAQLAARTQVSMGLELLKNMLTVDPRRLHPFTGMYGSPQWFISKKRCPNLWRETKELQRIFSAEGKWEFFGSDHALDDVRYVVVTRPDPPKPQSIIDSSQILAHGQIYTSVESKISRAFGKFDRTFGKDPSENSWFPKA